MRDPLAYFLTFRTYGTWLHGDARGSVDDLNNRFGTPLLPPNDARMESEVRRMRHAPMTLTDAMREVVDETIRDHCRYRNWELMELAVRTNHVHVLVGWAGKPPERVAGELKARATRWLRDRKLVSATARVWADRAGSTQYIWDQQGLTDAGAYILDGQDVAR